MRPFRAQDDRDDDEPPRARRVVDGRGQLPSRRATLGAALVVLAAAGVLTAHRSATRPPTTRFVVAAHDVPAGSTLRKSDLGTLAMELPSGVGSVTAADARKLIGTVTLHPLRALDLVRPNDVASGADAPDAGSVEVPVEIDRARSLGSSLRAGSRVDVLSTDPDGEGTVVLARDVLVVAADRRDDGFGSSGATSFRLAVPDSATATAVVDASVRSRITLVLPDTAVTRG